ncbi:MAG: type II secretion system F family protein [Chloroflexota bacterium]
MGLPLLMALLAASGVLLIFWALPGSRTSDPVRARLSQLGALEGVTSLEEIELQQPLMDRTLRPLMRRLSGLGSRLTSRERIGRTESKLAQAGYPYGLRTVDFMGLKVVAALTVGGLAFLLFGLALSGPSTGVIIAAGGLMLGFFMPDLWLGSRIRARKKAILLAIPDVLDLLTISVKAGLGFDAALGKVVEKSEGPLTDEFRRVLAEVRIGKARREALRELVARTNVPALSNFIGAIIQAESLGVAIANVLEVQSEQLRIERRQRAEEMAAKAPIKMLFPLVGCIFPSMFIVILGPAMILITQNLNATGGL